MLIHYVVILLSSHGIVTVVTLRPTKKIMIPMNEVITSEDAELIRKHPFINFDKAIRPVRGFPGIKLKVVKTGQRLSFENLFDKMLLDCRNRLVRRRRQYRPKFTDLHAKVGNSSEDYFNATGGFVADFTTMWRYGRMELTKCKPNLTMDVLVTFYSLRIHYKNFILCVANRTWRGRVAGHFQRNIVQVRVNFTLRPFCVYRLISVHLNEFGHPRYEFEGLKQRMYGRHVTEAVSYSITRHFVDTYRRRHEKNLFKLFDESFRRVDPCPYFNYNPNEW